MRRTVRLGFWVGLAAAVAWVLQRWQQGRPTPAPATPARPAMPLVRPEVVEVGDVDRPGEPEVGTVDVPPPDAAWVEPEAGGTCPASHPVKAKLTSKIFHLPGMLAYDRTNPDRCYRDEAAAEADGLRRAKR